MRLDDGWDKDMRVDPVTLRASAGQTDVSADDLRAQHGSAHERIAAAQAGWIGASAVALTAKAAQWEEQSAAHYTELVKHGNISGRRRPATLTSIPKRVRRLRMSAPI
jgi:uncharacterized protein YukE